MPPRFEELDYRETPLGGLSLRRRTMTSLDNLQVHEIILGTEFLMSSMFTEVEEQLSWLGIAAAVEVFGSAHQGEDSYLDVVIGGLGLGYTARAALESTAVKSLMVVDYLEPVIEWHQQGLVPLGKGLTDDPRCRFVHGDFFKCAHAEANSDERSFEPEVSQNDKLYHAILLDIDHTPENLLHSSHSSFYKPEGLKKMAKKLLPKGIFAMWADGYPIPEFEANLCEVFPHCETHLIKFINPLDGMEHRGTVHVARLEN